MGETDIISLYIETALELERLDNIKTATRAASNAIVRKHNKLADKLIKIAIEVNTDYPHKKEDFFRLLYHENKTVRDWVRFQIIDNVDYDYAHRKEAMKSILEYKKEMGELWFKMWLDYHPECRELL